MQLFDPKTGQPVEVPDEQVPQALSSGQLGMPADAKVRMVNPEGEVWELRPQDVSEAAGSGWAIESASQERARVLEEKYGGIGGEALAAGAGALRGLTFGGSDYVLGELFGLGEELKGLREADPTASMVGEIGAVAGSLLIPGGQGRAVTLGRQLGAGPRAVAGLGRGVEQAVGRMVAPLAERGALGRVAARGLEVGAGAAVEGAIYGAGQYVSEVSLGNTEASAEGLLTHVGLGAALGGGLGAGLGGGFRAAGELVDVGGRLTRQASESIVGLWERQTGQKAIPGLADELRSAWGTAAETVTGAPRGLVRELSKKEARAIAVQPTEVRDAFARDMAKQQNIIIEGMEESRNIATGVSKKAAFREKVDATNVAGARTVADDILGRGIPTQVQDAATGRMIPNPAPGAGGLLAEVDDLLKAAKNNRTKARGMISELQGATDRFQKRVQVASDKADEVALINGAMDDYKRTVQNLRSRAGRTTDTDGSIAALREQLESIQERVRKPLELPEIWGKAAASAQKEINEAWVGNLKHIRRRPDHSMVEAYESADWEMFRQARPQGFRSLVDDMGSTKYDLDAVWMRDNRETSARLLDAIENHHTLGPESKLKFDAARAAMREMEALEQRAMNTVGLQNQLKQLEAATSSSGIGGVGVGGGAVAGGVVAGPIGALVGGALGAVLRPAQAIRQLAVLDRLISGQRERIGAAIKNLVARFRGVDLTKRARRMVAPAAVGAIDRHTFDPEDKRAKPRDRQEAFARRIDQLQSVVTNQARGIDRLAKSTKEIDKVAPKIAGEVRRKAVLAAQHLLDTAPQPPGGPALFKAQWKPSDIEIARWERRIEAAVNPESIIKDLENGTLSRDSVDTLRTVYPQIYQQVLGNLLDHVDELRESMPYDQRIAISVLFDAPIDDTMRPEFVAAMQAAKIGPPQQGGVRPKRGAWPRTDTRTEAQRIDAG